MKLPEIDYTGRIVQCFLLPAAGYAAFPGGRMRRTAGYSLVLRLRVGRFRNVPHPVDESPGLACRQLVAGWSPWSGFHAGFLNEFWGGC